MRGARRERRRGSGGDDEGAAGGNGPGAGAGHRASGAEEVRSYPSPVVGSPTQWSNWRKKSMQASGTASNTVGKQSFKDFTNETLWQYFLEKKTELQEGSGASAGRKRKDLGPPWFLVAVSAHLHKGQADPSGAASEECPWTATQMGNATLHLTSLSLKFSLEQQFYVAKHLDFIVMVLGDGAMPGSLGLPYWCDRCLRPPVAIGCWFLLLKSNGQWRWFCPFCGGELSARPSSAGASQSSGGR